MIGNQQRRAINRKVLGSSNLDPEPGVGKSAQHREIDSGREFRVESERIDGIVTLQSAPDERHYFLKRLIPVDTYRLCHGRKGMHRISSERFQLADRQRL